MTNPIEKWADPSTISWHPEEVYELQELACIYYDALKDALARIERMEAKMDEAAHSLHHALTALENA